MNLSNRLSRIVALAAAGLAVAGGPGAAVQAAVQAAEPSSAAAEPGPGRIQFVNPEAASRVCRNVYRSLDAAYQIGLAKLGEHLFIEDRELVRGVTSHVTIGDPDTGLLYIVSTRLKGDAATDRALLDRVEERLQALAVRFPTSFTGKRGNGPFGRTFETTLINASKGSDEAAPFPITVGYTPPKVADAVESVAVHRHFVTQGYYFELAVLLRNKPNGGAISGAALLNAATAWLDTAMQNLTPGRTGVCVPE